MTELLFQALNASGAQRVAGLSCVLVAALLGACAHAPPAPTSNEVTPFSAAHPGGAYPGGWHALGFSTFRKETKYALVEDCGSTVVRAHADGSSSGLVVFVDIDPSEQPWLTWRWKVPELVPGADNTRRETEDAPARIDVSFDGDMSKLPFGDRLWARQVKALTGMDLPYATLEYVWGEGAARDAVIVNTWTGRIRMLMLESGPDRLGQWVTETRNVYEDYERVFGEKPGKITAVGIITDTDATGTKTEAYYGDIALSKSRPNGTEGDSANNSTGLECSGQPSKSVNR